MHKIIPCLDIKDGRVVKGVHFQDARDAGDPSEAAAFYCAEGADELVFLDITATTENRSTLFDILRRTAERVTVPLTVGGGIRSVEDAQTAVGAGADKISVNSAAVKRPAFIGELAERFGSEKVVAAIDGRRCEDGRALVCVNGGFTVTDTDVLVE